MFVPPCAVNYRRISPSPMGLASAISHVLNEGLRYFTTLWGRQILVVVETFLSSAEKRWPKKSIDDWLNRHLAFSYSQKNSS